MNNKLKRFLLNWRSYVSLVLAILLAYGSEYEEGYPLGAKVLFGILLYFILRLMLFPVYFIWRVIRHFLKGRKKPDNVFTAFVKKVMSDTNEYHENIPFERPQEIPTYRKSRKKIDDVDSMEGRQFEKLCAELFYRMGYCNVEVTKSSGDHGVDVLAEKDDVRYAIQCKRYNSNIGNTPVQEIAAGKIMYGCQVGIVITNQFFTDGAIALANANGILLRDRNWLIQMLEQCGVDTALFA